MFNLDTCPGCGHTGEKVIYKVFPMWMCMEPYCHAGLVWGFWCWVLKLHFDGFFIPYGGGNGGSYLGAVWFWFTNGFKNDDEL